MESPTQYNQSQKLWDKKISSLKMTFEASDGCPTHKISKIKTTSNKILY